MIEAKFQTFQTAQSQFNFDVDITLPTKGITTIFGHSGSGKTTLLRCIAGLHRASNGHLKVNGEAWQTPDFFLPTHKRPLGYVFQESSLFPHLTAEGNLNYAIKRCDTKVEPSLYQQIIEVMGIGHLLKRKPQQLSGGECQRVAIARALLIQPKLLLMDEPLASLDMARKQEILPYLEHLRSSFDIPVLYVSHSMDEVARLADQTLVLEQGKVIAQGPVTDVFSRIDLPIHLQEQTGIILQGMIAERDEQWHLSRIAFNGGSIWVRDGGDALNQSVRLRVLARDISLALTPNEDSSILNRVPVEVTDITNDDDEAMALVRLKTRNGHENAELEPSYLIARITRRSADHLNLSTGQQLWAQIKSAAIVR
jgi:molybdate transport system ATP-binding protein